MNTIFEKNVREKLISRINTLNDNSTAQWGKMTIYQMLKHCTSWEEWILGKNNYRYKQEFLGLLFGKIALKRMLKIEKPFDKNIPTSAHFKVKEKNGDVAFEKKKWIALLEDYDQYSNPGFVHDFFGKMTNEQIGLLAYKHTDHHLRQFNA